MQASFCQVCYDIGKSESLYTNHTITDKDGVVICPTLISFNKEKQEENKEKKITLKLPEPEKACMSCVVRPIDVKFTKYIVDETCAFCSRWCLIDYEYDVCNDKRKSFYSGYTKRNTSKDE